MPRRPYLLCACLAWPAAAAAHTTSQSSSQWTVQGAQVDTTLLLSAADFQEVSGADRNGDGTASPDELSAAEPLILLHARQTIRVWQVGGGGNATPCPGVALGVDWASGQGVPPRFPMRLQFTCPHPVEEVRLGFNFFAGTALRFSHVAQVHMPVGDRTVAFSPDHRDQTLVAHPSTSAVVRTSAALGVQHILWNADHLLLLLVLLMALPAARSSWVPLASFTVAHGVALAAAAVGQLRVPAHLVQAIIAASVVCVALGGQRLVGTRSSRVPAVGVLLALGLVHGLECASALQDAGLPQNEWQAAVVASGMGVEMGQLLGCTVAALGLWLVGKSRHSGHIRTLVSGGAGAAGAYWLVTRLWGA